MPKHKLIEVDIKNKKHIACCGTIKSLLNYMEKTQQTIKELQKNQPKNTTTAQKITELDQNYNDLKQKAEICGCTD